VRSGRPTRLARAISLLVALADAPTCPGADFSLFLPRPIQNGAYIDLFGAYEKDHVSGSRVASTWSDLFLKEKLTVFSDGYFYHPRFLRYHLSLTPILKQESYDSTATGALGWNSGQGLEYEIRLALLPEHAYGLEVFSMRYEPLFRELYELQHNSVTTIRGAELRYRRKPWLFRARATDEEMETGEQTTSVQTLNVNGQYLKEYGGDDRLSLSATATPSRFRNSYGLTGDNFNGTLDAALSLGRLQGSSNLTLTDFSQQGGGSAATKSDQLLFSVLLGGELARNLRGDASFRYQDSASELGNPNAPAATSLSRVQYDAELTLRHQLYQSLQTTYTLWWDSGHSTSGQTEALSNALSFSYVKQIPNGRITAGLSGALTDTDSTGQTSVVDESHPGVPVPGAFLLGRPNVDPASLAVFVRSPREPFELVRLVENVHYGVSALGNALQVTVFSLPPEFPVPGSYDFRASYTLEGGDFRLRTTTVGQNASVSLFRDLLTPYYSYTVVKSDVLAGVAPGGGLNSRVFAAGLSSLYGPLRARLEYQDVYWDSGPYHGFRGELQYSGAVAQETRLTASLSIQQRHYDETSSQRSYVETITAAGAGLQQYLYARALTLSAGGAYSQVRSLYESRSYSINATLSWKVGLLDVSGGASYTVSESLSNVLSDSRREHGYYYLRLRRTIF